MQGRKQGDLEKSPLIRNAPALSPYALRPLLPATWISVEMEYRYHDHCLDVDTVEDTLRKSTYQHATDRSADLWRRHGSFTNPVHALLNRPQERVAQTWTLTFVPTICIEKVRFGFGTNDQPDSHECARIRSRTASHESPAFGSLS